MWACGRAGVCACMCVCERARVCVCVCLRVCAFVCVLVQVCVCVWVGDGGGGGSVYVCFSACVHACVCACKRARNFFLSSLSHPREFPCNACQSGPSETGPEKERKQPFYHKSGLMNTLDWFRHHMYCRRISQHLTNGRHGRTWPYRDQFHRKSPGIALGPAPARY